MVFGVLLAAVITGAFASPAAPDEGTQPAGRVRVLSASFAPFLYAGEDGRPEGFEHDILASFAEANGLDLEIVWVEDFATIFDALQRGDGDLISSTLTITGDRLEKYDFSVPYFSTRVVLVQRVGSGFADPSSLAGKTVLTVAGTTYESILQGLDDVDLHYVPTEEAMYEMLAAGVGDALATDSANFLWVGRNFPNLETGRVLSDRQFYGFALRKGDPLKHKLDNHIEQLVEDGTFWLYLEEAFGDIVADNLEELKRDFLADTP